jgi:hypothetical protein
MKDTTKIIHTISTKTKKGGIHKIERKRKRTRCAKACFQRVCNGNRKKTNTSSATTTCTCYTTKSTDSKCFANTLLSLGDFEPESPSITGFNEHFKELKRRAAQILSVIDKIYK